MLLELASSSARPAAALRDQLSFPPSELRGPPRSHCPGRTRVAPRRQAQTGTRADAYSAMLASQVSLRLSNVSHVVLEDTRLAAMTTRVKPLSTYRDKNFNQTQSRRPFARRGCLCWGDKHTRRIKRLNE